MTASGYEEHLGRGRRTCKLDARCASNLVILADHLLHTGSFIRSRPDDQL